MRVAIIGTGYVGLTTGVCLAFIGHQVSCLDTDESKIEASYNNGILSIHIPKSALAQPKKIQIKSGEASSGSRPIEGVGTSTSGRRVSSGDNMNQQQQQPMAASGSSTGGKSSPTSRRETGAKS